MPRINIFLTFNNQAEEAAKFYVSIFKNSKLGEMTRFGEGAPLPAGSVMTVAFELDGKPFIALNGGPHFKFTEAFSLSVECESQGEIDMYWNKLCEGGGRPVQCGWLTDRFGVSWQVVPATIGKMMSDPDKARSQRVVNALLGMVKLDMAALERAYQVR